MRPQLSIVVPAFNEAHRLEEGFRRLRAAVDAGCVDLGTTELIVVDDGSGDGTADEAARLLADVPDHRIVHLPTNRGKGAAVRAGVAVARGDHLAYMDADFAIDPQAVPLLVDGLHAHDLAIGCRALRASMVESTYVTRSLMGRLFNQLVTTGTGLGLRDTQCGFKGFRTPVARLLFHLVRIDRFAFDVELLLRAHRLGLRITEVPVHWKHVPGSTVHPAHDSISMLADVYRARLGLVALRPVPVVTVARRPGAGADAGLASVVGPLVARALDGAPVPLLDRGASLDVLLPLVEPDGIARVLADLQDGAAVTATPGVRSFEDLRSLGPLHGRLEAAPSVGR